MRSCWLAAGLSLALVSLASSPLLAGDDLAELKVKIEATSAEIIKATLAGDLEAEYSYYTDDLIYMPEYSPMIKGKEAVKKHADQARFRPDDFGSKRDITPDAAPLKAQRGFPRPRKHATITLNVPSYLAAG